MRRLSILAMMVAALLLVAGTASAQSKPNFTGKWTLVPDPNAPPPGGGGGGAGAQGARPASRLIPEASMTRPIRPVALVILTACARIILAKMR